MACRNDRMIYSVPIHLCTTLKCVTQNEILVMFFKHFFFLECWRTVFLITKMARALNAACGSQETNRLASRFSSALEENSEFKVNVFRKCLTFHLKIIVMQNFGIIEFLKNIRCFSKQRFLREDCLNSNQTRRAKFLECLCSVFTSRLGLFTSHSLICSGFLAGNLTHIEKLLGRKSHYTHL